jgi:2-methylcitrate dehydratase
MSAHADVAPTQTDPLLTEIIDYVYGPPIQSDLAWDTARWCLMDSLGCAMMALKFPACTKLLGPVVPGATLPHGARVPGTAFSLEPVMAAFNLGAMVRWLDYNDTWLAAEWGHPSDNLGAILACADYRAGQGQADLTMEAVLEAMIRAHEIQGILAINNGFNRVGLDHVLLVRIASTAVAAKLLGASRQQALNALSLAWIDGGALRTYRHAPSTGSRKSWAAGDATSRAVRLALIALTGEMGYPLALSSPKWGFQDVLFRQQPVTLARPLESYVMEHVLFKISFPAEFHAQTAVEAALTLHPHVADRLDQIERIEIETQEPGVRIIDKRGPLNNPADRDHCLQYMIAVPLVFGRLVAEDYEDNVAADPRIDALRAKMNVRENENFSRDYYDLELRSIPNSIQVFFADGSATDKVEVHFPVGHRRRREEGLPLMQQKYRAAIQQHFSAAQAESLVGTFDDLEQLRQMPVRQFVDQWVVRA